MFQTIKWDNLQFLLLVIKTGECLLFTVPSNLKDNFTRLPALRHPYSKGSYPVDAEFFVHDNNLYLFLIYDTLHHERVASV